MNYQDMPIRAYSVEFVRNTAMKEEDCLPPQIFQGRSMAEAVEAAEAYILQGRVYVLDSKKSDELWDKDWASTGGKPKFIIGTVLDLGIIKNQEVLA